MFQDSLVGKWFFLFLYLFFILIHGSNAIIQSYTLVITREILPGFNVLRVAVNGSSPGPPISVFLGNTVRIKVINAIYDDATSIHWHGMEFRNTPWMDGLINITQCPISNQLGNNTFIYEFTPTVPGTFWYHGHYHSQLPDGLYGPLIIRRRDEHNYFANKGLPYRHELTLMVGDSYEKEVRRLVLNFMAPFSNGYDAIPDSIIVNNYLTDQYYMYFPLINDTSTGNAANNANSLRLRLINAATSSVFNFSIDGLPFYVVEIDGVAIQPLKMSVIRIQPAQRYSIIVNFDPIYQNRLQVNSLYFRFEVNPQYYPQYDPSAPNFGIYGSSSNAPLNFLWKGLFIFNILSPQSEVEIIQNSQFNLLSNANLYIPQYNLSQLHHDLLQQSDILIQTDENLMEAIPDDQLNVEYPSDPITDVIDIKTVFYLVGNNQVRAYLNGGSLPQDYSIYPTKSNQPPKLFFMLNSSLHINTIPFQQQSLPHKVEGSGIHPFELPFNHTIDVFINGYCCGTHPFHLHGHHFWILNTSDSDPNHHSRTQYPYRDIVTVPFGGYAHIRFVADNPGIWLFHCHLFWHLEMGLGAFFVTMPPLSILKDLRQNYPKEELNLCDAPLSSVRTNSSELTFQNLQKQLDPPISTLNPSVFPTFLLDPSSNLPSFVPTMSSNAVWWWQTRPPADVSPTATMSNPSLLRPSSLSPTLANSPGPSFVAPTSTILLVPSPQPSLAPLQPFHLPTSAPFIISTTIPTSTSTSDPQFPSFLPSSSPQIPSLSPLSSTSSPMIPSLPTQLSMNPTSSFPSNSPMIPTLSPQLSISINPSSSSNPQSLSLLPSSSSQIPSVSPVSITSSPMIPSLPPINPSSPLPSSSPNALFTQVPTALFTSLASSQDLTIQVQYLLYLSNLDIYNDNFSLISNAVLTFLSTVQSSLPKSVFSIVSYGQIQRKPQSFPFLTSYQTYDSLHLSTTNTISTFNIVAYIDPVSKYFPVSIYGNNLTEIMHSIQSFNSPSNSLQSLSKEFNQILIHLLQQSSTSSSLSSVENITITDLQISLLSSEPVIATPSTPPTPKSSDRQNSSNSNNFAPTTSNHANTSVIVFAIVFAICFLIILCIFIYFIRKSCSSNSLHNPVVRCHDNPSNLSHESSPSNCQYEIEEGFDPSNQSRSLSSQENN